MTKVVSFVNYKGGVGKTTIAVEISAAIAHHFNKGVLLIDADPQTNATFYLMNENAWQRRADNELTVKALFDVFLRGAEPKIEDLIISNGLSVHGYTQKMHLIPSHLDLYDIDLKLASNLGAQSLTARSILRRSLQNVKDRYDYVIIDCPPNMYLVTQNAILASDGIIVVMLPEYFSTRGVALIDRIVDNVSTQVSRDLSTFDSEYRRPPIKGIIFNRVRRGPSGILIDQQRNIDDVKNLPGYGELVFDSFVSESVRFPERTELKVPISVSGSGAYGRYEDELRDVSQEFLNRV